MAIQSAAMLIQKMEKETLINFVISESEQSTPDVNLIKMICKVLKNKL